MIQIKYDAETPQIKADITGKGTVVLAEAMTIMMDILPDFLFTEGDDAEKNFANNKKAFYKMMIKELKSALKDKENFDYKKRKLTIQKEKNK